MKPPVSDESLISGRYGEIGGLVMIKRDLARARIAANPKARIDCSFRTDDEQREWQLIQASFYDDLPPYVATPLTRDDDQLPDS